MNKPRGGNKKIKWLFGKVIEIPKWWKVQKLEKLADILDSKRVPIKESEREKRHGKYPYYGASGIIDYIDDFIFNEKLLCLAEDGENLRSRVLPIAFTIEGKTWVNNHAHVLRVKETIDHYFLKSFLNNTSLLKYVASTAQPKLNQKDMRSVQIICPKLEEQTKIASILSGADALIESTQKVIEKTERLKKGLMQKLLTKGIGHTEFREVKSMLGKYERIPKEWEIKKLDEIGKIISGGTPDSTNKEYWSGNILWATPTDITKLQTNQIENTERKITKQGLDNSSAKLLPKGTILITSRATIGECAIATQPIATNQGFQSIICNDRNFDRMCIFYLIRYHKSKLLRLAYGTTFLEINKSEIKKAVISIPALLSEQQKIASILSGVDAYIQKNQEYKKKIELLKKGLMQKLLTGQIRVKVDH